MVVYGYSVAETKDDQCVEGGPEVCACVSAKATVTAVNAGPTPPRGKDVTLWVQVPSYEGQTYGVAFGKSAAAVAGGLEKELSACGAKAPERSTGAFIEARRCEECMCT